MRIGRTLILVLAIVVVCGFVAVRFDWPPGVWREPSQSTRSTDVPRYSNVRGLQDAPRDDVAQGVHLDMRHCLQTMTLRGLTAADANHTCEQLIAGISR